MLQNALTMAGRLLNVPDGRGFAGPARKADFDRSMREKIDFSQVTFLITDRDPLAAALVRDILRSLGANVVHRAGETDGAIKLLRQGTIDVLIAEWEIGPLSGLELLDWVRISPQSPTPMLPIIMLTAQSEPEIVAQARDRGATEFLAKPFTAERFFERLASVIVRPREFVRLDDFFGPDRRRRKTRHKGTERREFGR